MRRLTATMCSWSLRLNHSFTRSKCTNDFSCAWVLEGGCDFIAGSETLAVAAFVATIRVIRVKM